MQTHLSWQTADQGLSEWGGAWGKNKDYKGAQGLWGSINMFIILIVAMAFLVETYVKIYIVHFKNLLISNITGKYF